MAASLVCNVPIQEAKDVRQGYDRRLEEEYDLLMFMVKTSASVCGQL